MATINKRGSRWLARVRMNGTNQAQSFATEKEAKNWSRELEYRLSSSGRQRGLGPTQTSLAVALLDYAHTYARVKKGCVNEIRRINAYLAGAGLPVLKAIPGEHGFFELEEQAVGAQMAALPAAFAKHRAQRNAKRSRTAQLRARLALMPMSQLATHDFRDLCNAMCDEGLSGDTIRLEFALLRHLFGRAIEEWHWVTLSNPLTKFKLPKRNAARDRRLTSDEATRLWAALDECRNPWVKPFVEFAIETAMRRSEMLIGATWADVDLDKREIYLKDTKQGGSHKVPLTKRAVAILKALPRAAGDERIFALSANELKCAWARALQRAGIQDLRIHDLRHEGASRHAKRLNGNIFLLKKITGHKSVAMLERYVNPGSDELFAQLDATEPPEAASPPPVTPEQPADVVAFPDNIVAFRPRDSASVARSGNQPRSAS